MMRQDPLVQHESLLLQLLLLRLLSPMHSLLFFRGSQTSKTGLLQEAQTLVLERIRQQLEAMRLQLQ